MTMKHFVKSVLSNPGLMFSFLFIICLFALSIFPVFFTHYSAFEPSGNSCEAPGKAHWLGTDDLGIDIWSQISFGSRTTLLIGLGSAFFAGLTGTLAGIVSGYLGGVTDKIIMRTADTLIALPDIPLIIMLATFTGAGTLQIILVLTLLSWTGIARIVRSKILALKTETFIIASKSYGADLIHIISRHCIPAIFPLVLVCSFRIISRAVIAEASLSFIGLGDPTTKSWGLMLHHAMNFSGIYFTEFWKWWITVPVIMIVMFVLSVSFIARQIEFVYNTKKV